MIFGCPIYLHVPKENRSKIESSGRKGTFVGYNESSKDYRIYIPGQRQLEVRRDVIFEEEIDFQISIESQMEIDNEAIPSPPSTVQRETTIDPVDPVDVPKYIAVGHKNTFPGSTNSAGGRGTCNSSRNILREKETKEIFEPFFDHEPHH
jgi:hypothetical protein